MQKEKHLSTSIPHTLPKHVASLIPIPVATPAPNPVPVLKAYTKNIQSVDRGQQCMESVGWLYGCTAVRLTSGAPHSPT